MRYKVFWFRATTEKDCTKSTHVFVSGNMDEAREYSSNIAKRSGSNLIGVEVISREQAIEKA